MKQPHSAHEPHLAIRDFVVAPGGEWKPRLNGWSLILARDGAGYCLQRDLNQELSNGAVLLVPGEFQGSIRASQLGRLGLVFFSVVPKRLGGLLTLNEHAFFHEAASRKECPAQVLPPHHTVAAQMRQLCTDGNQRGLLFRLKLLQLFAQAFGDGLDQPLSDAGVDNATERLRVFLKEAPSSELLEMSFNELAHRTHCTSRHLSRIFRELVGMSFRDKRAELRLAKARELLVTSDAKIVDVALDSGYKSLSLFNLMFSRRFGTSPGKWRQKYGIQRTNGKKSSLALP